MFRRLRPDKCSNLTVQTDRRLMQMSRLFVFLGQHFFMPIMALLGCLAASKSVHIDQKPAKKQQVRVFFSSFIFLFSLALFSQNIQAAVQGQIIFNSASLTYAETATPVVTGVGVTFVQRTAAQLGFLQFSTGSGVGTATAVGQTACQDTAGNFSTINTYQTLNGALQSLPNNPLLQSVSAFKLGEPIFLKVSDADQNLDLAVRDTVLVTIKAAGTNDQESIRLVETGVNTGIFAGVIQSTALSPVSHDCQLSVAKNQNITASYVDQQDATDAIAMAVLVDPQGIIFNSSTGAPIDGVTITLWDITNNQPATVLGDDGVSTFPATVVTGSTAVDSSGTVYAFSPGAFRFPFVSPGNYRFQLTAPVNFKFPSLVANVTLQNLAGAPFDLAVGSRGETFAINPGPIINIDIPLDPNSVALFIDKKANKTDVAIGDFIIYSLTLTNPNPTTATTSLVVHDQLPEGFHYRVGSAQIAGVDLPATVDNTGRGITFNTTTVPADGQILLTYVAEVGAKTQIGDAVNQAWANGAQGTNLVQSNLATLAVNVRNELFSRENILMGRVFVDGLVDEKGILLNDHSAQAGNGIADRSEEGLNDVRIYLEDGRFVQTDKDGFYHFEGVRLGTHIVQLDTDSLPENVIVSGLDSTRFSNRGFSQFVDLSPGSLWRTNFRVFKIAPPAVPVKISQHVSVNKLDSNELDVTLDILRHPRATLDALDVVYRAPSGWTLVEGSAQVNAVQQSPHNEKDAWVWSLDKDELATKVKLRIRFTMQRGGEAGEKVAQAVARFVSHGSKKGNTAIADAVLIDIQEKSEKPRKFSLQTHFDAVKATLKSDDINRLNVLIAELKTLNIHRLEIEGHTDSQKIRSKWWHFFRNNSSLSDARGHAVADYLQKHLQLSRKQVHVTAKGSSEPVGDNATQEGRASNRRAVIRVFASEVIITERTDIIKSEGHGLGEAPSDWVDSRKKVDAQALKQAKIIGILSPTKGQSLPFQVAAVRIQIESRLKPRLFIDGNEVTNKRIGFKLSNQDAGTTLYSYIGVDFGEAGEHRVRVEGIGPFGNVRFEKELTVIRTGEIRRIIKISDDEKNIADGKTRVRVQIELQDEHGQPIQSGTELEIISGDLRSPVQHDIARLREANKNTIVQVDNQGWVEFEPVSQSGQYSVVLAHGDIEVEVHTFIKPEYRNMVMVGLAEGTLGYRQVKGHMDSLPNKGDREGWYQDGRLAFYAKGRVKGKWLLTAAYDTAKTQGRVGNSLLQTIQPDQFYTVYGDKTNQHFDAPSSRKLYLKLERDTFYALFGDFSTGLSITELSRFTRTLNGVKSEWHKDQWGYKAFISQTSQTLVHDEILGDGTSGLYHLTRQRLIANTEKIIIETRDRFRSEVIHDSRTLTRFVDYDIDYENGTLFFKQPIMSRDSRFNPIYIVVDYETRQSNQRDLTVAGGRGYIKPVESVEVGVTAVQQEQAIGDDQMLGVDANYALNRSAAIKAEIAQTDTALAGRANAWKIELDHQGKTVNSRVYYRDVENGFGLGQVNRSENGTQKYGVDVSAQINAPLSVDGQIYRQKTQATSAIRDVVDIQGEYKVKKGALRLGARQAKDELPTESNTSNTIKGGGTLKLSPKWSARIDHEQSIGNENSIDYPTRTTLGADFMVSPKVTLFGEQEWARGQNLDINISRLGVRGRPWTGAQLSTSMESRISENSERAFANVGLQQTWKINELWSIDGGVDRTQTLKDNNSIAKQPNPIVPLSSGGVEDFTALTAGASYRPEKWEWSGRLEYRTSNQSKRAGLFSAVLGDINSRLSATGQIQGFVTRSATLGRTDSGVFTLGAAWRPTIDRWIALDRFDIKYSHTDQLNTGIRDIRFVNNLNANWQANAKTQLAWQYGAKYVRETINGKVYKSALDLIGAELEYNISKLWDVHVNARRLYSYRIQNAQYHTGVSVGRQIMDNLWGSLGYNFSGFYDNDFSANDFTAQGPFLKIRLKFDQKTLRHWLKNY